MIINHIAWVEVAVALEFDGVVVVVLLLLPFDVSGFEWCTRVSSKSGTPRHRPRSHPPAAVLVPKGPLSHDDFRTTLNDSIVSSNLSQVTKLPSHRVAN